MLCVLLHVLLSYWLIVNYFFTSDIMPPVPLTSLKIAVKEHQCFQVLKAHIDKLEIFCNVCSRSINMSKSNLVPNHLESSLHQKNVNLRKKRLAILVNNVKKTYIKKSQSQNYCAPNESNDIQEIEEKLIDLKET